MPAKNSIKLYLKDGYYHIYNRGVAKSSIFLNDQDYGVFLDYLKDYLSIPRTPTPQEIAVMQTPYLLKNYHQEIELISFCLMPNHFHLLLKQKKQKSIEGFMRSVTIRYSRYFNRNHDRVGHLFQDVYKAILVDRDEYLWWLSRYIHRNPLQILTNSQNLEDYPYSSYPTFLKLKTFPWIKPEIIFENVKNYREFMADSNKAPEQFSEFLIED